MLKPDVLIATYSASKAKQDKLSKVTRIFTDTQGRFNIVQI